MGQSSTETVKEIEEVRERLDGNIRKLEERLPAPAIIAKRLAGVAVGGGVGGTVLMFAVRRMRSSKEKRTATPALSVELIPDRWMRELTDAVRDGRARRMAAGAGALWLAVRLAELRQLRRLNRALVATRA